MSLSLTPLSKVQQVNQVTVNAPEAIRPRWISRDFQLEIKGTISGGFAPPLQLSLCVSGARTGSNQTQYEAPDDDRLSRTVASGITFPCVE